MSVKAWRAVGGAIIGSAAGVCLIALLMFLGQVGEYLATRYGNLAPAAALVVIVLAAFCSAVAYQAPRY